MAEHVREGSQALLWSFTGKHCSHGNRGRGKCLSEAQYSKNAIPPYCHIRIRISLITSPKKLFFQSDKLTFWKVCLTYYMWGFCTSNITRRTSVRQNRLWGHNNQSMWSFLATDDLSQVESQPRDIFFSWVTHDSLWTSGLEVRLLEANIQLV